MDDLTWRRCAECHDSFYHGIHSASLSKKEDRGVYFCSDYCCYVYKHGEPKYMREKRLARESINRERDELKRVRELEWKKWNREWKQRASADV